MDSLLEDFVATFEQLGDMSDPFASPEVFQLLAGNADEWRPLKVDTPRSSLSEIYAKLPGPFPPLFEQLVLSYRWAEVDLGFYRLLANPPGTTLQGLLHENVKRPRPVGKPCARRVHSVRQRTGR